MSEINLCYLSEKVSTQLGTNILENIARYRGDGFSDLAENSGWKIEADIKVDLEHLEDLEGSPGMDNEVKNSLLIWRALHNLTPALATENRIWVRLSHVEGFQYSKSRWLKTDKDDDSLVKQISDHFFAPSLTRYRDDHAISRLWWNAFVAKSLYPDDQEKALRMILSTADIRSNLMERSMSFSRSSVGSAVLRKMIRTPKVCKKEKNFREFMKQINRHGGGIVFETLEDSECDVFMDMCWKRAKAV